MTHPEVDSFPSQQVIVDVDGMVQSMRMALSVSVTSDMEAMHGYFEEAVTALGAESAWFASVDCDPGDRIESIYLQSACDPEWIRRYVEDEMYKSDAWIQYAMQHIAPIKASQVKVWTAAQEATRRRAADAGLTSCALFPAREDLHRGRFGLLVLGHSTPEHFERDRERWIWSCARELASELHTWWIDHRRRELLPMVSLTGEERLLLQLYVKGQSSEEIAQALHVTWQSVNSRFQRLNRRLRVPHRRVAAQMALECGLIDRS